MSGVLAPTSREAEPEAFQQILLDCIEFPPRSPPAQRASFDQDGQVGAPKAFASKQPDPPAEMFAPATTGLASSSATADRSEKPIHLCEDALSSAPVPSVK